MKGSAPPALLFPTSLRLTSEASILVLEAGQTASNGAALPVGEIHIRPFLCNESIGVQGGASSTGAVNKISRSPLRWPQAMAVALGGDGKLDSAKSATPGEQPVAVSALEVHAHQATG